MHVAESDDQALDEFIPANYAAFSAIQAYRDEWNPKEFPMSRQVPPTPKEGYAEHPDPDAAENVIGSPSRVAEQIALMRDAGIRNLMLTNRGTDAS